MLAETPGNENGIDQVKSTDSSGPVGAEHSSPSLPEKTLVDKISGSPVFILLSMLAILITIIGRGTLYDIYKSYKNDRVKTTPVPQRQGNCLDPVEIDPHFAGNIINIPFTHNPNFTGRVDLLDRLHEALTSGKYVALTAITGLGKTQLALEYAYRHKADYKIIWWVKSEEPATLAADYADLATKLGLPPIENLPDAVDTVRSWLEKNDGWLLVFDNAQNFDALADYLPRTGTGDVIITSRDPNWGGTAQKLPVDVFSRDESIEFLRSRTGKEDGAGALADALGNLPLALEQAGAYIEKTEITLADYLKRFQEHQKEVLKRGKPSSFPDTVATTWNMSFERVEKESSASADLLNLCAFLAPDNIPKSLLTGGAQHLPEPLATVVADELKFDDVIAALKRYSLVTVADDSVSVHRLVQAVTRDRLDEDDQKRWAKTAVQLVDGAFPFGSYDVRNWPECSLLLLHALAAAEHAERLGVAPESTGRLLNQVGIYLLGRAEFGRAKSVLERALKIFEAACGPDHPEVARPVMNLGTVLQYLGDFEGAKKCHARALKIFEVAYGPDHPEVARTVMNLGNVLRDLGDFEGAKECHERALKIFQDKLGEGHPHTVKARNNLAALEREMKGEG